MLYFSETVKSDEQQQLQTKQGRALGFVLGITTEVLQFDKARKKLKASPNNEDLIQAYLYITAVMETRVSQAHTNIKTQLKEVEQQYFRNCGKLPTGHSVFNRDYPVGLGFFLFFDILSFKNTAK